MTICVKQGSAYLNEIYDSIIEDLQIEFIYCKNREKEECG